MAKRDFAAGIKDLEMGVGPGLSRWAQNAVKSILIKKRQEGDLTWRRRQQHDHRGRDGSDVTTS